MTPEEILRLQLDNGNTIAAVLCSALEDLWRTGDLFSRPGGMRPDGSWQWGIYAAMIKAGLITGKVSEDGECEDPDTDTADDLVCAAIRHTFGFTHKVPPTPKKEILPW